MDENKKENLEKVKKGFSVVAKIFYALLTIAGLLGCAAIIYVLVKSGMAIHDAWVQIFG